MIPFLPLILFSMAVSAPFNPIPYFDVFRLPLSEAPGMLQEVSSYDRENLNYRDGFYRPFYLYAEPAKGYVVFEEAGPGVLLNAWMPRDTTHGFVGQIRFYFDDDTLPRYALDRDLLFSGQTALFPYPLAVPVDSGSGGDFLIAPLPFKKKLTIAFSQPPSFYHFLFKRITDTTHLDAYDSVQANASLSSLLQTPYQPQGCLSIESDFTLEPGQSQTLFTLQGPTTIGELYLKTHETDMEKLNALKLFIYFDDKPVPNVSTPLGMLFGCGYELIPWHSYLAHADSNTFRLSLPMPVKKNARFVIRNASVLHTLGATLTARYALGAPAGTALTFHAFWNRELGLYRGRDYTVGTATGRGHFVGSFVYPRAERSRLCLEGDERFYADGRSMPDLHGTGLEDYFLSGWYFDRGLFNQPITGLIASRKSDLDEMAMYRFHLSDRFPFLAGFKAGIEKNTIDWRGSAEFSSVGFWYAEDTVRLLQTDTLVLTDTSSERRHAFKAGRRLEQRYLWSGYAGDSTVGQGFTFNYYSDSAVFTLRLKRDNQGAVLRLFTDCMLGGQSMDIHAGTRYAGRLLISAENPHLRFYDADFFLPETLTQGQDSLRIRLRVRTDNRAIGINFSRVELYSITADTVERNKSGYADRFDFWQDWGDGTRQMLVWNEEAEAGEFDRLLIYRDTTPLVSATPDHFIGLSRTLSYTDDNLVPGKKYWYKIEAFGRNGKKHGESSAHECRLPGILYHEGEWLLKRQTPPSCSMAVPVTYNEGGFHPALPLAPQGRDTLLRSMQYLSLYAKQPGDSAVFNLPLPAEDTFDMALGIVRGSDFGRLECLLNGEPTGLVTDGFSDSMLPATLETRIPLAFKRGDNRLVFRSTGKSAKSTGYRMGIDWFRLQSLSQRYRDLPDSLKIRITDCYPNPFNALLKLKFETAEDMAIDAAVFDIHGKRVMTLEKSTLKRRTHQLVWDGRDHQGRPCASGVYLVRITGRFGKVLLNRSVTALMIR